MAPRIWLRIHRPRRSASPAPRRCAHVQTTQVCVSGTPQVRPQTTQVCVSGTPQVRPQTTQVCVPAGASTDHAGLRLRHPAGAQVSACRPCRSAFRQPAADAADHAGLHRTPQVPPQTTQVWAASARQADAADRAGLRFRHRAGASTDYAGLRYRPRRSGPRRGRQRLHATQAP